MSNPPPNPPEVSKEAGRGLDYWLMRLWKWARQLNVDVAEINETVTTLQATVEAGGDDEAASQMFYTYHDNRHSDPPAAATGDGTSGGYHTNYTAASRWMCWKFAAAVDEGDWKGPVQIGKDEPLTVTIEGGTAGGPLAFMRDTSLNVTPGSIPLKAVTRRGADEVTADALTWYVNGTEQTAWADTAAVELEPAGGGASQLVVVKSEHDGEYAYAQILINEVSSDYYVDTWWLRYGVTPATPTGDSPISAGGPDNWDAPEEVTYASTLSVMGQTVVGPDALYIFGSDGSGGVGVDIWDGDSWSNETVIASCTLQTGKFSGFWDGVPACCVEDGSGNLKVYKRASGSWTLVDTFTKPTEWTYSNVQLFSAEGGMIVYVDTSTSNYSRLRTNWDYFNNYQDYYSIKAKTWGGAAWSAAATVYDTGALSSPNYEGLFENYTIKEIGGKPVCGVFGGYGVKLATSKYTAPYYYFDLCEYDTDTSTWSAADRAWQSPAEYVQTAYFSASVPGYADWTWYAVTYYGGMVDYNGEPAFVWQDATNDLYFDEFGSLNNSETGPDLYARKIVRRSGASWETEDILPVASAWRDTGDPYYHWYTDQWTTDNTTIGMYAGEYFIYDSAETNKVSRGASAWNTPVQHAADEALQTSLWAGGDWGRLVIVRDGANPDKLLAEGTPPWEQPAPAGADTLWRTEATRKVSDDSIVSDPDWTAPVEVPE